MKELKSIQEVLMDQVQSQISNLTRVNTHELGEVIDMIKDLEETMYYCSIVKAMEEKEKQPDIMYYREYPTYRDMSYPKDYMDYSKEWKDGESNPYESKPSIFSNPYMTDYREGRSPRARKNYVESKELHHDKSIQMQELEKYLKDLSSDITELVEDASPEERTMLRDRMTTLASKIK